MPAGYLPRWRWTRPAGRPHISYYVTGTALKYAHYDGVSWHIETIDDAGNVGGYTSLALDAADHPHISYFDWTNGRLRYAHHDGTSWAIATVDATAGAGRYTS